MLLHCCRTQRTTTTRPKNASLVTRAGTFSFARAIVAGGGLILLPKCPACLAAYLAVVSGIGISLTAARFLQAVLLLICIASLAYFAVKAISALLESSSETGRIGNPACGSRSQWL